LELDKTDDFFRHAFLLAGANVLANSPGLTTHFKGLAPSREAPNHKTLNQIKFSRSG